MALTKHQIAAELAEMGIAGKNLVVNVLDGLAELAGKELRAGENFRVPGIVTIDYRYRKPAAKGERWKAGEEIAGPTGLTTKPTDSPVVRAAVALKASIDPKVKGHVPKLNDAKQQARFLSTKAGKRVVERKAR